MVKKIILRDSFEDNFSLKKLVKKVGNAVKDSVIVSNTPITTVGKAIGIKKEAPKASSKIARKASDLQADFTTLSMSPITNAGKSVLNKPLGNEYNTKIGKVAGKVSDTSQVLINSVSKGFADGISGGAISKGKDWAFSKVDKKNKLGYQKQSGFRYGELKGTPKTGIKSLDKAASYAGIAGTVVGTAYGGYTAGSTIAGGKDDSNIKPTNVVVGDNVLDQQQPIVTDTEGTQVNNGLPNNVPFGVQPGDIPGTQYGSNSNIKTASMMNIDFKNPYVIGGIVLAIILLVIAAKHRK